MTESYRTAVALHQQNRLADAERHYRAALAQQPQHPGVLHGLGVLCAQTNRLDEAADLLRRAVATAPHDADAQHHLGLVLKRLGRHAEAGAAFEAALRLAPGMPDLHRNMGDACLHSARFADAEHHFRLAIAARPDDRRASMGLGDALCVLGRPLEAQTLYDDLLAHDPDDAGAFFGLGNVMIQLGRIAEARTDFERAIALNPRVPAFHRALGEIERFRPDDPRLAPLEALAHEVLADEQRVELHFALAKAYDDLERRDDAFEHWRLGNRLKRSMIAYDEAATLGFSREVAAVFRRNVIESGRCDGEPSEIPVFVVGMPRSGTSLVEQILASHPEVFGAGELTVLNELIAAGPGDPLAMASADAPSRRRFGTAYVERVRPRATEARRIVDKLPGNFLHLGLIRLTLPRARIIHVRRDARDTCLSCYGRLFLNGLDFTYDLGELGRYWRAYDALMAHWRAALPEASMLEVQYETLVGDFEAEARRLVEFCGLAWDERCLRFHETDRAVRTHSRIQVREPLTAARIGRWRAYERHLEPLIRALG